jgi:molecular chaperone GrpE (heat shock protein)
MSNEQTVLESLKARINYKKEELKENKEKYLQLKRELKVLEEDYEYEKEKLQYYV